MPIKNRLLEIRLKLGYKNVKDFADFLGLGKSNYSLIENNKKQRRPPHGGIKEIINKLNEIGLMKL
ncbi:hypothetical protein [Clostridium magnum]|uniref:Helix-turn-helix domain protein n=1 Tax=Clostridium magnum DSM 2767 TaxID=1121326 RepID=A0A162QPI0_9CLOT|nr:hypothetical protein [Clostridium magnum]KZL88789.1 hypothetical protein CLMAG_58820 [Clostridium magnum DSM 2767]SHJ57157.1 hypothetical protein SAMN02745944_06169 [Clostridium magnum DSM 2767]